MTSTLERFRSGATVYRNTQALIQHRRDSFIADANDAALPVKKIC